MNFEAFRDGIMHDALSPLQSVRLADFIFDRELYLKEDENPASFIEDRGGLAFSASQRISFDTFFNCFYERHWTRYTSLSDLQLALHSSGTARVDIYRTDASGVRSLTARRIVEGNDTHHEIPISLDVLSLGQLGRLHFEIVTDEDDFVLHEGSWATRNSASKDITLTIVICTYNKAAFVARNIVSLIEASLKLPALTDIIVVDQGTRKVSDENAIRNLALDNYSTKLHIIEQPNFGGAGGFTRGIIEFLENEGSHVVLMDDDVIIDPYILERLISLLNYSNRDFIVGGEMLDLYRPRFLYCHSEFFDKEYAVTERVAPYDIDLTSTGALNSLVGSQYSNYNAWFLCCFPRAVFNEHGLPLPVFVRSDDCEFGTRLAAAGIEIVHFPGFCVWHEPFYAKSRAWIEYYSYRNLLIGACMQTKKPNAKWARRYYGAFMYYIHTYQYDFALAMCLALEDLLKGPSFVFDDPRQRYSELIEQLKKIEAQTYERRGEERSDLWRTSKVHPSIPEAIGFTANIIWTLWPRKQEEEREIKKVLQHEDLHWRNAHGYQSLFLLNPHTDRVTFLEQDSTLARSLCWRMLPLLFKLRWGMKQLHADYRSAAPEYTSLEFWKQYLGVSSAGQSDKAQGPIRQSRKAASLVG
jgi:galactofuranosylgalactofuranosylrhamnosyl-N-acetylglucosaminyl-diphospho-decaprenol beta-1,5/1,6-galactofuranosyltransferase